MTTRLVLAPSAPSQASEFGAWPFVCFQGWKWSLTNTESKPTSSARQQKSSNSRGPNCSAEALYPSFSTSGSYQDLPRRHGGHGGFWTVSHPISRSRPDDWHRSRYQIRNGKLIS